MTDRVFKFRAWDKEAKKMLIPPFKGLKGICLIPTSPGWSATGYWDANKTVGFDCSVFDWADAGILTGNMVIMQYVGLKDKNGREIYEGDVLCFEKTLSKFKKGHSDIMVVKYIPEYTLYGLYFYSIYGGEGYTGNGEPPPSLKGIPCHENLWGYVKEGAMVIGHKYQEKFSEWIS